MLVAPDTIAAKPVRMIIVFPPEMVAAATPISNVKVEMSPSFNPKMIDLILPPPVMCSSILCKVNKHPYSHHKILLYLLRYE